MVALGGRRLIREPNTAEIPVPGAPSTTAPKPAHRAHTAATVAFSGLTVSCLSLPDGLGQMWLRATPANAPSSLLSHPVVAIRMFKASSLHMALDPDMQSNFLFERTVAVEMAFPSIFNELYLLLPQHQLSSSNSGWVKIRFTIDANARAKVGLLSASKCIQSAGPGRTKGLQSMNQEPVSRAVSLIRAGNCRDFSAHRSPISCPIRGT